VGLSENGVYPPNGIQMLLLIGEIMILQWISRYPIFRQTHVTPPKKNKIIGTCGKTHGKNNYKWRFGSLRKLSIYCWGNCPASRV
jgi:hypothetical protein